MIEDGKLTYPVKGATLIGNGPDALTRVTMVGNDLELDARHRHLRQGRAERSGRRRPAYAQDRGPHRRRHRLGSRALPVICRHGAAASVKRARLLRSATGGDADAVVAHDAPSVGRAHQHVRCDRRPPAVLLRPRANARSRLCTARPTVSIATGWSSRNVSFAFRREELFEALPHRFVADVTGAAGVDAYDLFILGPGRHHRIDVASPRTPGRTPA